MQKPVEPSTSGGVGADQRQYRIRIAKLGENVFEHGPAPAGFVPAHGLAFQIGMPLDQSEEFAQLVQESPPASVLGAPIGDNIHEHDGRLIAFRA